MTPPAQEAALQPLDIELHIPFPDIQQHLDNAFANTTEIISDKAFLAAIQVRQRIDRTTGNIGYVAGEIWNEMRHGHNKVRSISSFVGTAGIWGAGIAKVPSAILIPTTSMEVLERSGSSLAAGAATTAVYGAWALASTRSWSSSVENFPDAVDAVSATYPRTVKKLSESLPCLREDQNTENIKESRAKRLGKWILNHTKRGIASYSVGSMPYMLTTGIEGKSRKERSKLGNKLSADGAAVVGAITLGVSQLIVEVEKVNPEAANIMQEGILDMRTWFGIAGLMMIRESIKNKKSAKAE